MFTKNETGTSRTIAASLVDYFQASIHCIFDVDINVHLTGSDLEFMRLGQEAGKL